LTAISDSSKPSPFDPSSGLNLRSSRELMQVPAERAPAPDPLSAPRATSAPVVPSVAAAPRSAAAAVPTPAPTGWRARLNVSRQLAGTPPPEVTWMLASVALGAGVGWIYERRQRLRLDSIRDTYRWPGMSEPTVHEQKVRPSQILTQRQDSELMARSVYPSGIGETKSRREATLIDLHDMRQTLQGLREQHDFTGATELLEQHIVDFRYTSPWVFLELREQYQLLDQPREWDVAREVFRNRFGQNAPRWAAPSTAQDEIANDGQLCQELLRKWPRREARMFILRWMLGDAQSRQKSCGPPRLTLGVYRDLMLLDSVLDDAMQSRAPAAAAAAIA
jgi:hypothetical protein